MQALKYIGNTCLIVGGILLFIGVNTMNVLWFIIGGPICILGVVFKAIYNLKNGKYIPEKTIASEDLPRNDRPAFNYNNIAYLLMGNKGSVTISNPTAAESEFLDGIYRKYSR